MASIFTYDPEPPRVASPWLQSDHEFGNGTGDGTKNSSDLLSAESRRERARDSSIVRRLQAEPQEGPIEYKLHLLLRPRRTFRYTSTASAISGSRHSRNEASSTDRNFYETVHEVLSDVEQARAVPSAASVASMQQARKHRLEQLTTQLLWRLQQSSPHHASSATNTILPRLPEASLPELEAPKQPGKLLHGLEESQGALYEIGVSDDGALIGLAEDEMQESLTNLRAMAACLGCTVEVLRKEIVGECEWWDDPPQDTHRRRVHKKGKLVVAEALVKPFLRQDSHTSTDRSQESNRNIAHEFPAELMTSTQSAEQLRITLAGPTMSGKSTLLGTLTTSTLDNGKGKSRLSMLKHRHEITSGITSSVTQELLGYRDSADSGEGELEVINYATENVASWIDMHAAINGNRLVFISDSAGHPRYHRTTIRGLVGWMPHYILLCVPADDTEDIAGQTGGTYASQQALGPEVVEADLSSAQLELCLRLKTPLVIVVTKLDLASRAGLKATLTKILDALKAAGRIPAILPHSAAKARQGELQSISGTALDTAYQAALPLLNNVCETVPIVLTSAVHGTGIATLHGLLHELPLPSLSDDVNHGPGFVFHVEDVYSKLAEVDGVIVSGRLRSGRISVGDVGTVGPFPLHEFDDSEDSDERTTSTNSQLPTSRSFPGALKNAHFSAAFLRSPTQEWRRFKVGSIRNLRLPVHALELDQVGTIAIVPDDATKKHDLYAPFGRIRKGMVLTALQRAATRSFTAEFKRVDMESLSVGSHVIVYIASVRASARVVSTSLPDSPGIFHSHSRGKRQSFDFDVAEQSSDFDRAGGQSHTEVSSKSLLVTLCFDNGREYVVEGDQVLIMPSSGLIASGSADRGAKGIAGLEGFVGRVTQISA